MVTYMELHHAARNKGTGTMNISRNIAIALVGLSIGLGATSANAGFLGDIVGKAAKKVTNQVQQSAKPQSSGGETQLTKYYKCIGFWNDYKGPLNQEQKRNVAEHCRKFVTNS